LCTEWNPSTAADSVINKLYRATAQSEFVKTVAAARRDRGQTLALGDTPLRLLFRDEITQLERQGNSSADWSRVLVVEGFDWRWIEHSSFQGDVILGRFARQVTLAEGLQLPAGIYRSTLANCVIGHDALIRDVKILAGYIVCPCAILLDCGSIVCEGETAFGNGSQIPLGIESGGREVPVYAEIDVESAAAVARSRAQPGFLQRYQQAIEEYIARVRSPRGIIGTAAKVRTVPKIRNTFIGPCADLDGATLVTDSTILSGFEEPTLVDSGAAVSGSILQWGSRVTTMALVERSVVAEHAHVERHGKLSNSMLGPNSCVGGGEVTASLVGPFVNLHHQALLIATLWPEGRGNISYGANVGANHTVKMPDQEFWPGEGAFLGLGVNVKFPANFSQAPYLVMASGVTTLPQKIQFPFSLVKSLSASYADVSPAYNEIIPAWLLTDNLYAVKRNEDKFRARNKARRSSFDFRVFRPDIVDLMQSAWRRLAGVSHRKEFYTDRDIDGLGKNILLESHRVSAIAAYRYFIRYYALRRLKTEVAALFSEGSDQAAHRVLTTPSDNLSWEHARLILYEELGLCNVAEALRQLPAMLENIARHVADARCRDDERGARIIEDYTEAHVPAARDPVVQQAREEVSNLKREVDVLLERLEVPDELIQSVLYSRASSANNSLGLSEGVLVS
jgi:hypothetical protein